MASLQMINLTSLIDDVKCSELIRHYRWPDGVRCTSCCRHRQPLLPLGTELLRARRDSGKKIHGINIYLGVQKYGITLAVDVSPANMHDTKGIESPLRQLAG
jgi:hypothetical protein